VFLLIGVVSLSTNRCFSARKLHDNLIARQQHANDMFGTWLKRGTGAGFN
jgi:hypothetical protein